MVILMFLWSYDQDSPHTKHTSWETKAAAASTYLLRNDSLQKVKIGSVEWFCALNFTLVTRPSAVHSRLIDLEVKHTTHIDAAGGPLILKAAFMGM